MQERFVWTSSIDLCVTEGDRSVHPRTQSIPLTGDGGLHAGPTCNCQDAEVLKVIIHQNGKFGHYILTAGDFLLTILTTPYPIQYSLEIVF